MEWTDELPTKAGWYWVKSDQEFIVEVKFGFSELCALSVPLSNWNKCQWAGPIPRPQKPKKEA